MNTHNQIELRGPAGKLEGIFWTADSTRAVPFASVVCHPHPLYQGTMHNKVVYQAAKALNSLGVPVLRFNFRGVGGSEGHYDHGRGEEDDVRAALDFLESQFPGIPLLVAGFSFGAWVGLCVGCGDARVIEMVGLGLPIDDRKLSFDYLRTCVKPKLLVQAESDQYAAKPHFESFVRRFSSEAAAASQVVFVPGDHFFAGHLDEMREVVQGWVTSRHQGLKVLGEQ